MSDIFISYTRADQNKAELIAEVLLQQGWSVWWDRQIPPGQSFDETIENALNSARCVMVLWSQGSVSSRWVRTEAAEGADRGILVPVLIDRVAIPLEFKKIEAADLSDWKGSSSHPELDELLKAVASILGYTTQTGGKQILTNTKSRSLRWWKTTPGILATTIGFIAIAITLVVGLKQARIRGQAERDGMNKSEVSRQGKLGDEVSTAQWVFQIRKITKTDEYVERYYHKERIIRPKGENDILIVIDARLKNRLQKTQSPVLTEREPGNTGIIDNEGRSYQPLDYDARQKVDKIQSYAAVPVLPDAFVDFALVFSVPKGTKPETLIFTVMNYDSLGRGTDVKVSLD